MVNRNAVIISLIIFIFAAIFIAGVILIPKAYFASLDDEIDNSNRKLALKGHNFWLWFNKHEKAIYNASSDNDRSVLLLLGKLKQFDPHLTCKLGPIYNGKRELALCYDPAPSKNHPAWAGILAESKTSVPLKNWKIGLGYKYPSSLARVFYRTDTGLDVCVYPKDVKYVAVRNNDKINVHLYLDKPVVSWKTNKLMPIDYFLEKELGQYYYLHILGRVDYSKSSTCKNIDTAKPISQIYNEFNALIPTSKLNSLNSCIQNSGSWVTVEYQTKDSYKSPYLLESQGWD